jgi:hypothetical protein
MVSVAADAKEPGLLAPGMAAGGVSWAIVAANIGEFELGDGPMGVAPIIGDPTWPPAGAPIAPLAGPPNNGVGPAPIGLAGVDGDGPIIPIEPPCISPPCGGGTLGVALYGAPYGGG